MKIHRSQSGHRAVSLILIFSILIQSSFTGAAWAKCDAATGNEPISIPDFNSDDFTCKRIEPNDLKELFRKQELAQTEEDVKGIHKDSTSKLSQLSPAQLSSCEPAIDEKHPIELSSTSTVTPKNFDQQVDEFLSSYKTVTLSEIGDDLKRRYHDVNDNHLEAIEQIKADKHRKGLGKRIAKRMAEAVFVNGPVEEMIALGMMGAIKAGKWIYKGGKWVYDVANKSKSDDQPKEEEKSATHSQAKIEARDLFPSNTFKLRVVKGAKGTSMIVLGGLGMAAGVTTAPLGGVGALPFQVSGLGIEALGTMYEYGKSRTSNNRYHVILGGIGLPGEDLEVMPLSEDEMDAARAIQATLNQQGGNELDGRAKEYYDHHHHKAHHKKVHAAITHTSAAADVPLLEVVPQKITQQTAEHAGAVGRGEGVHGFNPQSIHVSDSGNEPAAGDAAHAGGHHQLLDVPHLSAQDVALTVLPFVGSYYLAAHGAKELRRAIKGEEQFPHIMAAYERVHQHILDDHIQNKRSELLKIHESLRAAKNSGANIDTPEIYGKLSCLCKADAWLDELQKDSNRKFERRLKYLYLENKKLQTELTHKLKGRLIDHIQVLEKRNNQLRKVYESIAGHALPQEDVPSPDYKIKRQKNDPNHYENLKSVMNQAESENVELLKRINEAVNSKLDKEREIAIDFNEPTDFEEVRDDKVHSDLRLDDIPYHETEEGISSLLDQSSNELEVIQNRIKENAAKIDSILTRDHILTGKINDRSVLKSKKQELVEERNFGRQEKSRLEESIQELERTEDAIKKKIVDLKKSLKNPIRPEVHAAGINYSETKAELRDIEARRDLNLQMTKDGMRSAIQALQEDRGKIKERINKIDKTIMDIYNKNSILRGEYNNSSTSKERKGQITLEVSLNSKEIENLNDRIEKLKRDSNNVKQRIKPIEEALKKIKVIKSKNAKVRELQDEISVAKDEMSFWEKGHEGLKKQLENLKKERQKHYKENPDSAAVKDADAHIQNLEKAIEVAKHRIESANKEKEELEKEEQKAKIED